MRTLGLGATDWLRVGTLTGYLSTVLLSAWLLVTTEPVEGQIPPGGGFVFLAVAGLVVLGVGVHALAVTIAAVVQRWRGTLHRAQRVEGGLGAAIVLAALVALLSDLPGLGSLAPVGSVAALVSAVALPFATLNVLRVSRRTGD